MITAWLYAYKLYITIMSTYFYDQSYYRYACNIDSKIIQMTNCLLYLLTCRFNSILKFETPVYCFSKNINPFNMEHRAKIAVKFGI